MNLLFSNFCFSMMLIFCRVLFKNFRFSRPSNSCRQFDFKILTNRFDFKIQILYLLLKLRYLRQRKETSDSANSFVSTCFVRISSHLLNFFFLLWKSLRNEFQISKLSLPSCFRVPIYVIIFNAFVSRRSERFRKIDFSCFSLFSFLIASVLWNFWKSRQ